ncbi:unnamed protein product, partial [Tenebrio molitor]
KLICDNKSTVDQEHHPIHHRLTRFSISINIQCANIPITLHISVVSLTLSNAVHKLGFTRQRFCLSCETGL